ncbi:LacI family transcriptional regulator [Pseudomonas sp.]|uniref:LacI family transcriptional regulator n=1 Tax=Pseudomonas sp. TaxID=306 RepID=UPI0040542EFE
MSKKHRGRFKGEPTTYQLPSPAGGVQLETFVPWTLVKRGIKKQVITPLDAPDEFAEEARQERQLWQAAQDSPLLRALGLAHHWQRLLDEGRFSSITEIAAAEEIDLGHASHIARLALLAPDIITTYVTGGIEGLALEHLTRRRMPTGWDAQRERATSRAGV